MSLFAACGDDTGGDDSTASASDDTSDSGTSEDSSDDSSSSSDTTSSSDTSSTDTSSSGDGDDTTDSGDSGDGDTGGDGDLPDPNEDGPYGVEKSTVSITAAGSGGNINVLISAPSGGPSAGPYPVILLAHGFQLAATQYEEYASRLASFGYLVLNVDFSAGFLGANHVNYANDVLGALDWVGSDPTWSSVADLTRVGATGHSLGGKLSVLAASYDDRIKATITLDPVDGATGCNDTDCPDASDTLPLNIPMGFIGETIDASGGGMSCAPVAENFLTFYGPAASPALVVDVLGANHMSFIDDIGSCGLPCSFCNAATEDQEVVKALSRSFVVAFYERHLRGITGYDSYLTGAMAQSRYVDTGIAGIQSK